VSTRNKWREKAQEAERKAQSPSQVQAQTRDTAPQQQQETADTEFWDDPDKWRANIERNAEVKATARAIDAEARVMRRTVPEFAKAEQAFIEAASQDPSLIEAFRRHDDRVGFALEKGKELLRMKELGATSLADIEAKVEARVRAEYEAKGKQPIAKKPAVKPPKSLAGARSVSSNAAQSDEDDGDELDEIFPKR
jgi:hypothetical protein